MVGFLAVTSGALLVYAIWLCLHNISLMGTKGTPFVGFANFMRLATDWRGIQALGRTALFVLSRNSIEVALGIAIAMFLDKDFPGKRFVRAVILVPMIMTR